MVSLTKAGEKFCTIMTDASHCPHELVAGWAVWIVCEDERYKRYDAFFEKVKTAHEAEMKAIINGLVIARRIFQPTHFHVVSDCMSAMQSLQGKGNDRDLHEHAKEIVGNNRITFAHVKAHSNKNDKRTYVNNWCDFNAKMAMKSLRTKPKEE